MDEYRDSSKLKVQVPCIYLFRQGVMIKNAVRAD